MRRIIERIIRRSIQRATTTGEVVNHRGVMPTLDPVAGVRILPTMTMRFPLGTTVTRCDGGAVATLANGQHILVTSQGAN